MKIPILYQWSTGSLYQLIIWPLIINLMMTFLIIILESNTF